MKAVIYDRYGPPEVLQLTEVEKPVPKDHEVLVKIHATTVTQAEIAFRRGVPFAARLFMGLTKPKIKILGVELSGVIEEVGKDVTRFKSGDHIYGEPGDNFGAYAEYICLPENATIEIKPANQDFHEAAASPDGFLTAMPFLRKTKVVAGTKILINGASGSIGSNAVQLAKYLGAHVTGVCSTSNVDMVKSLGTDEVIDYKKEDFTSRKSSYDVIFDTVGKSSFSKSKVALKKEGHYLTTVSPSVAFLARMLWTSAFGRRKALFIATGLRKSEEKIKDLVFLRGLIEEGKIRPVIDRKYPLEEIAEAHAYVEAGHKKGNVVIAVV